ncbi:MAG: lactate utilization protein [Clostridiaceae bacterium]|jgi:hypothetical protein|nr:lactate utilization protein [Clostridiaceae bacterium]
MFYDEMERERDLNKTVENLERNGMRAVVVDTREEAARYVEDTIPAGASVAVGGSVTLKECGIIDLLKSGKYNFFTPRPTVAPDGTATVSPEAAVANYRAAYGADYYLSGSNAITREGELYNVDGRGNRVSAIAYGPQKVIIIAGINKIVKNLDAAVARVKTVAAPQNCRRLGIESYCAEMDKCHSFFRGGDKAANMTDGCLSNTRICCHYLVSSKQSADGRITVVLVKEKLGY